MRNFLITILCVISLLGTACHSIQSTDPRISNDFRQQITESTFASAWISRGIYRGSGVVTKTEQGCFVWTAYHLLERSKALIVIRKNSVNANLYSPMAIAHIIAFSKNKDLALLKLNNSGDFLKSSSFYKGARLPKDILLYNIGAPNGRPGLVSLGRVTGYITFPHHNTIVSIITSNKVAPGSSGSGIFLKNGKCAGIIWGGHPMNSRVAFAIPHFEIMTWAKENSLLYAMP